MEKTNFTYTIEQLRSLMNLEARNEYIDFSFVTEIGADLVEQSLILQDCKSIYNEDPCVNETCDPNCAYASTCVLKENGKLIDNQLAIVSAKAKQRIPIATNFEDKDIDKAYTCYMNLLKDKNIRKKLPSITKDELTKMLQSRNFSLVFNDEYKIKTEGRTFITQTIKDTFGKEIAEEIAQLTFQKSLRDCR